MAAERQNWAPRSCTVEYIDHGKFTSSGSSLREDRTTRSGAKKENCGVIYPTAQSRKHLVGTAKGSRQLFGFYPDVGACSVIRSHIATENISQIILWKGVFPLGVEMNLFPWVLTDDDDHWGSQRRPHSMGISKTHGMYRSARSMHTSQNEWNFAFNWVVGPLTMVLNWKWVSSFFWTGKFGHVDLLFCRSSILP